MKKLFTYTLLFLFCLHLSAQNEDAPEVKTEPHFQVGLYMGALFAGSNTASLYDGYGYTLDGLKNDFFNSSMYRKIVTEFGGGNGQPDRIAQVLNINHSDWSFSESDMPIDMKYNVAFAAGLHLRYAFNASDAILLNVNAAQLTAGGNFTLTFTNPTINPTSPNFINTRAFPINGNEQRLMFQLGFQKMLGAPEDQLNFFIELGPSFTWLQSETTQILINSANNANNLQITLNTYYNEFGAVTSFSPILSGYGIGAFGGAGLHLNVGSKWTLQLLYNLMYERIKIANTASFNFQHFGGFRGYYNF